MDKERLPQTGVPDSLLTKLFDATGNSRGGNKGFFLFFIGRVGIPNCVARPVNTATRLAIISIIEFYPDEDYEDDNPLALLENLFHSTGDVYGNNKGFLFFYINENGKPVYYEKYQDEATYCAISSCVSDTYHNYGEEEEEDD